MIRKDELLSTFSGLGLHMGERELPGAHLVWKLDSRNFKGLERLKRSFDFDNNAISWGIQPIFGQHPILFHSVLF